jgi:hypothetical protein
MMQLKKPLQYLLLTLTWAACGDSTIAATPDPQREFEAEFNDLVRMPDEDCARCYIIKAFRVALPIPTRFVVKADEDHCVQLMSPSMSLLGRLPSEKTTALQTAVGNIRHCPVAILDREVTDIEARRPVAKLYYVHGVEVKEWAARPLEGTRQQLYMYYLRTDKEGLLIADANPLLGKAILQAYERLATQLALPTS